MAEQTSPQRRVRIEVSTSVKGVKTYSCTVELIHDSRDLKLAEAVLAESDYLVAELDRRYPAPEP